MKQELFKHLKDEHNLTLLESELEEIIRIVNSSNQGIINSIKTIRKQEELTDILRKVENGWMDSTVAFDRIFQLFEENTNAENSTPVGNDAKR